MLKLVPQDQTVACGFFIRKDMHYLFTSESVSEGHPDKVSDQISDAILDNMLAQDPQAHVACETLCTTGQVVIAGEVSCKGWVDVQQIARKTIAEIGYTKSEYKFEAESCGILTALHAQSQDINMGVSRAEADEQGAGDQGMMFGYATDETDNYMPLTLDLAHTLVYTLARIRKEGKQMLYLRPDSKSQVTIEYEEVRDQNGKPCGQRPVRIDTIVLSTQHDENIVESRKSKVESIKVTPELIKKDVIEILLPRVATRDSRYGHLLHKFLEDKNAKLLVNPTGNFVIGGPHGDTGLTGRKIIVDTYGGRRTRRRRIQRQRSVQSRSFGSLCSTMDSQTSGSSRRGTRGAGTGELRHRRSQTRITLRQHIRHSTSSDERRRDSRESERAVRPASCSHHTRPQTDTADVRRDRQIRSCRPDQRGSDQDIHRLRRQYFHPRGRVIHLGETGPAGRSEEGIYDFKFMIYDF